MVQPLPADKKRDRRWIILAVILGIVALPILACWSCTGATVVTSVLSSPAPGVPDVGAPPVLPAESATSATSQGPLSSFGDGTWQVGVDIMPGTYKTVVPPNSMGCYWERDKNLSGGVNAIIANDISNTGAHVTVTILKTDKGFVSRGCGTWSRAG
jgi:hypothetical protein